MDFNHTELFKIQPSLTYFSACAGAPPPQDVREPQRLRSRKRAPSLQARDLGRKVPHVLGELQQNLMC